MTALLQRMYAERCVTPSDIYLHLPRMVRIVDALDARLVVELGTRTGVSTVAWLYALERTGGRLLSVDLDARPPIGDWPHWTFHQGDDLDPDVLALVADGTADIVFIDTSHHYEQTQRELVAWSPKVRPGGVIVLHDTELPVPEGYTPPPLYPVRTAVAEFVAERGWEYHAYPDCWGLGIITVPEGR